MLPRLFIGSSAESLSAAQALKDYLKDLVDVRLWVKDVFAPSSYTLDELIQEATASDLAVLLFTPDDLVAIRSDLKDAVRDNVIFEYGLFAGRLGRERCFFVIPNSAKDLRIPSDLAGITALTYDSAVYRANQATSFRDVADKLRATIIECTTGDAGRRPLGGLWTQCWNVEGSTNFPPDNRSLAKVVHVANHVRAEWVSEGDTFVLEGIVDGRIITGTWRNRMQKAAYVGAFQLSVSTSGKRMTGKWLGHRENITNIEAGEWLWER